MIGGEMDFTGKKVLIAGGAGFIGTNLALALARRGARLRRRTVGRRSRRRLRLILLL